MARIWSSTRRGELSSARVVLAAGLLAIPFGSAAAQAPAATDAEVILSRSPDIDKLPRLAGDWCCWTSDRDAEASSGSVVLSRISTGELWRLGDGCLPDVDVLPDGNVRVVWLQFAADGLAVRSLTVPADSPATPTADACLARGLSWADHVRVCGDVVAWSAADADGAVRIFACRGAGPAVPISREGEAFRPELVRDARGAMHCVWDAYLPGPGLLDYEIWHAVLGADGRWSEPVNVSAAPYSLDMSPSAAADPDGSLWLAWTTSRGGRRLITFVEKLMPDGTALLPEEYPPAAGDPGYTSFESEGLVETVDVTRIPPEQRRGTVTLCDLRGESDPRVVVDGSGRPWLFVTGQPAGPAHGEVVDRELKSLVLDQDGWSEPALVSEGTRDEVDLSGEALASDPLAVRVVYQLNSVERGGLETATRVLRESSSPASGAPQQIELWPPAGPPLPQRPELSPELPARRTLHRDGRSFRLVFADLHCHTRYSPDGTGERDAALFFARDVARLDAVAITDHDERVDNPLTDWEYELGRRFMALFDTPDFMAFMGFEWTSDKSVEQGEIPGHRACFDSACCYRYTDPAVDTLPELYARLDAEDAIGVPHHLGLFGGASFLQTDARAQPVTEVDSEHGEFERVLWRKLLDDHAEMGVIAGGDDHTARPGTAGLAGIWLEEQGPAREVTVENSSPRAALKSALRERRCFGARGDGLWIDALVEGVAPGSVLKLPADEPRKLHVHVLLADIPVEDRGQGLNVNLVRDGDVSHPLWQERVPAGRTFETDVVLPPLDKSAWLMLRIGRGGSSTSESTLLWTSPIRVEID